MTIQFSFGRRWRWVPFEERKAGLWGKESWEIIPWWKLEAWFYPADKDSHWGAGFGWLWFKIRIGGGT